MAQPYRRPETVPEVLASLERPSKALVTAGMPYANGPVHLGHLAGAQLPADITARWLGLLIGRENVLFVSGTDEHGSTSELAALKAGIPTRALVDQVHAGQAETLRRYEIGLDTYSGASRPECFEIHRKVCDEFLRKLHANGLLLKRTSLQWFDPEVQRFLPDRLVRGTCPNPKCGNDNAYSDECERCGAQYEPSEVKNPKSAISEAKPELRETVHWFLDLWSVSDTLRTWLQTKQKTWRRSVLQEVLERVLPALRIARDREEDYKVLRPSLPKHKPKYTAHKEVLLQFGSHQELTEARATLEAAGITSTVASEWGYRSLTRDTSWGMPLPDLDPELAGKTLYVWPDSLIAPISFTQLALSQKGVDPALYAEYWRDPKARVRQFLGQDNVFFYVLMQGALWLGSQDNPQHLPLPGELQLTDIYGCFHLMVSGEKMSKSAGNYFTGDQLLDEKGYTTDQIRYYLSLLGLAEKPSDFDFVKLDERNKFLSGPMNAAFERPIAACHSKFGGQVPQGELLGSVRTATVKMVSRYVRAMEQAEYPNMLFELENYARLINSLFAQFKPHDDRHPEVERKNALYSCFYVLKNLMIMLYPFVPSTMQRLRESLRLPPEVFAVDELGTPLPAGHVVGPKQAYFPSIDRD